MALRKATNKAKHNRAMQTTHCTGRPTLRFGRLCWRRYKYKEGSMKIFTVVLLFIAFNLSAKEESGVVVKILPDSLVLNSSCKAMADLVAQDFSILYACKDSVQRMYFYNYSTK